MIAISSAAALAFPEFDPVAISIFGLPIRWYSLAYIGGLVFAWWYMRRMTNQLFEQRETEAKTAVMKPGQIDDLLTWLTLGVIGGGRLGYVFFYNPGYYVGHPLDAFKLWDGGMSFHGGLLGVIIACYFFARNNRIPMWILADMMVRSVPIGLLLGRLANFINGELWGRPSDVSWAMVFPNAGPDPRHPSQLYEATLEGLLLFAILWIVSTRTKAPSRPGIATGIFFIGYGCARYTVEFFRQPDEHLGVLGGLITMGQLLTLPMFIFGAAVIVMAMRREPLNLPIPIRRKAG